MPKKCENKDCVYQREDPCPAAEGCAGLEEKNCKTCMWYAMFEGVCTNGDSEHVADFRSWDDSCEHWRG